jgi:hypothetical protein
MKKKLLTLSLALLFITGTLRAQTVIDHPLNKTNMIVNDAEFVIIHSIKSNGQSMVADIFDYDPKVAVNARIKTKNTATITTTGNSNMKSVNAVTLDFDGDKFDDVVYVNQNNNQGITVTVPVFDRKTLKVNSSQSITIANAAGAGYVPRFRLGKADFDRDGKDELVIAFREYSTEKATIQIYKIGSNNIPVLQAQIADVTFGILGGSWEEDVYDITVNDFDGDSIPDIAMANLINNGTNNDFKIYTYSVTPSGTWKIVAKGSVTVASGGNRNNYKVIALSSGYYNTKFPGQKQISLAAAFIDPADNLKCKRQLFTAGTASFKDQGANALSTITVNTSVYSYSETFNDLPVVNLKSGDLDQNYTDEIVFAYGPMFDIFTTDTNMTLTKKGNGSAGNSGNNFYHQATGSYLDIADVDKDFIQDIIISSTYDDGSDFNYFSVSIYDAKAIVNGNNPVVYNLGSLNTKASSSTLLKGDYGGASSDYYYALVFGDFDGGKGRLGAPTHMVKKLLTPLVIVNTPPYHFDVFGNNVYDITNCFPNYQCQMNSAYSKSNTTTGTIETTLKSDWAVSAKVSAGGSIGALGLSASLKATYGESFEKTNSATTTTKITSDQIAKGDDWIFADVTDYDIYEYPIDSNGVKTGYVLAKMRRTAGSMNVWMESKSPDAFYYIPDHEVGNVMSYPAFANFSNFVGGLQNIKGSPGGSCNIGSTTNTSFGMQYTDFAASSASTTKNFGIEASASASIYGFSLETEGSYKSSDLNSHSSTATTDIKYTSNFTSTLNNAINPAPNYTLTPYVYWGVNGAITLGYSVDPSPGGGAIKTFWSENYSQKPDLTFILPWRLDSAKGLKSTFTNDQPRLCKSIIMNKDNFITGDTARVTAWINNFSFKDFNGTAEFQFYIGPPDAGGTLLTDINGQSTVSYTGVIPGRGRIPLQFRFRMPAGLPSFPRIYVKIDPNNKIDEGHEDNNIGFNIINSAGVVGKVFKVAQKNTPYTAKLTPNPVGSDGTELHLNLPFEGYLNVEIRDMSGRLIKKLYESDQKVWTGNFILPVKTTDLINGIYTVNIMFNEQAKSLKLIKVE